MLFNPLSLAAGRSQVSIGDDPFTEGLRFTVVEVQGFELNGYKFAVYWVEAPCLDCTNEYAADGKVRLAVRVLPSQKPGVNDKVLLWEEGIEFHDELRAKVGNKTIRHAFADGEAAYTLFQDCPAVGLEAVVTCQGVNPRTVNVRYWVYQRPWRPVEDAPQITQYLVVEDWGDGQLVVERGYDMRKNAFRA